MKIFSKNVLRQFMPEEEINKMEEQYGRYAKPVGFVVPRESSLEILAQWLKAPDQSFGAIVKEKYPTLKREEMMNEARSAKAAGLYMLCLVTNNKKALSQFKDR